MNWLPIETYDAMEKKPKHAAFYFRAKMGEYRLEPVVRGERVSGHRVCTHWCPLPDTEELDKGGKV